MWPLLSTMDKEMFDQLPYNMQMLDEHQEPLFTQMVQLLLGKEHHEENVAIIGRGLLNLNFKLPFLRPFFNIRKEKLGRCFVFAWMQSRACCLCLNCLI